MTRPLFQRIPEIELEEGPRAAAIADELTLDGWNPLLHIQANMDWRVTAIPLDYPNAALRMDRYYRTYGAERFGNLGRARLGDWVG